MNFDGIIFDLDGTLWDSCRVVAESWSRTLKERYGVEKPVTVENIKGIMGLTASGIAERCFSQYGDRAMEICLDCMAQENAYIARHPGDVYPGVEDMFSSLSKKYPLFIVSNCQDGYIQCFLSGTGFDKYIKDIECEGSTGLPKAENIGLICRRNGIKNPLYVGDTAGDEKSARASGCAFIHAAYGFGSVQSPDGVINAPLELEAMIRALEEK